MAEFFETPAKLIHKRPEFNLAKPPKTLQQRKLLKQMDLEDGVFSPKDIAEGTQEISFFSNYDEVDDKCYYCVSFWGELEIVDNPNYENELKSYNFAKHAYKERLIKYKKEKKKYELEKELKERKEYERLREKFEKNSRDA